jgi:hypothetical protein
VDEKTAKQMAKMTDAVQPYCDEKIVAAMTCSHAGSMSSVLTTKVAEFMGGIGPGISSGTLPNPVFIAVGSQSVYAFDYAPKGFKFKIKNEVARWPKDELSVAVEKTSMMTHFVIATRSGESHALEVPTMMGGKELVDAFLAALGAGDD